MFSRQIMFSSLFVLAAVLLLELNAITVILGPNTKGPTYHASGKQCVDYEKNSYEAWREMADRCGFNVYFGENETVDLEMFAKSTCKVILDNGTTITPEAFSSSPPNNSSSSFSNATDESCDDASYFTPAGGIQITLVAILVLIVLVVIGYKLLYKPKNVKLSAVSARSQLETLQARRIKKKEKQEKKKAEKAAKKMMQHEHVQKKVVGNDEEDSSDSPEYHTYATNYSQTSRRSNVPKKPTRRTNSVKKRMVSRKSNRRDSLERVGSALFTVLQNNMK